jgi:hypothetical protein
VATINLFCKLAKLEPLPSLDFSAEGGVSAMLAPLDTMIDKLQKLYDLIPV